MTSRILTTLALVAVMAGGYFGLSMLQARLADALTLRQPAAARSAAFATRSCADTGGCEDY
jgi:hypothetical protein